MIDILGQALTNYQQSGEEQEIHVSSDVSLVEILPASYFFRSYESMNPMEQLAIDAAKDRILDIGAGAGCHAIHLQAIGADVTAIERSPTLCALMRQRGINNVHESSLLDWKDKKGYDTILLLMNGAGLAERMSGLSDLLEKLASLLAPDGSIYMDSSDISELYYDEEGNQMLDLQKNHLGEITYHLEYNGLTEEFPWVFPDEGDIAMYALANGLLTERLCEFEGGFLLRLFRPSP